MKSFVSLSVHATTKQFEAQNAWTFEELLSYCIAQLYTWQPKSSWILPAWLTNERVNENQGAVSKKLGCTAGQIGKFDAFWGWESMLAVIDYTKTPDND